MFYDTGRSLDWSRVPIPISRASTNDRTATVVVADAEPYLRDIYRTALEFHGHRVAVAADGLEALELVRDLRPDVALLDVDLPYLDGLELTRALGGNPATAGTSVMLLSIYTGAQHQLRALRAGCAGYLAKPFEVGELLEQVRRVLDVSSGRRGSGRAGSSGRACAVRCSSADNASTAPWQRTDAESATLSATDPTGHRARRGP